jgi:hypothetical protein
MTVTLETAARSAEAGTTRRKAVADEQSPQLPSGEPPAGTLTERDRFDAAFESGAVDAFGSGWPISA